MQRNVIPLQTGILGTESVDRRDRLLSASRSALIGVALISGLTNLLYFTGPLFMLEVYDRVLPSRSIPTLVGLGALALALFAFQGVLDLIRARILIRVGASFDRRCGRRLYEIILQLPLRTAARGQGLQPLRDLDQIRSFLSSPGPAALLDLPWIPLYLAVCFLFHPWIGIAALAGTLLLFVFTLLTERLTLSASRDAANSAANRNALAEAGRRNAEAVRALGMGSNLARQWDEASSSYLQHHTWTSDVGAFFASLARVLRLTLQFAVLGMGAYLVLQQDATAGIIIASSILTARALAPVELATAHWKNFVAARQAWARLRDLLTKFPACREPLPLPAPAARLSVENVFVSPPNEQRLIIHDVSFTLERGAALGIIGPSGSGKSSLARLLTGIWSPLRGKVRLDGAALDQWSSEALGHLIGYLPQDIELFAGTVAQNIARFSPQPDAGAIIRAAQAAGVHEMVLKLPNGYETEIGENGAILSAGQRQRVALARALYGEPFLTVLDEPNAHLDAEGEAMVKRAIAGIRARGGIAVVITHRPNVLAAVDFVMVMRAGTVQGLGPKQQAPAEGPRLRARTRTLPQTAEESAVTPIPRVIGETNELSDEAHRAG